MNIYWFTLIFVAWYTLALVVSEYYGKRRRIGVEWSFFISVMFTPVIGWLVSVFSKERDVI